MSRVLDVVLAHQAPGQVERCLGRWAPAASSGQLLLVHGGRREYFERVIQEPKVFVEDPRLRTGDHQREVQSLGGVWRAVADWIERPGNEDFSHLYFAEYDHVPVVADLNARLVERLEKEGADVLAHHLARIDGTSDAHFLFHKSDARFLDYWRRISVRDDPQVVLGMFGSGSFWRREPFLRVARQPEDISAYFEVYLPTLAHHLGYRLRDFGDQNRCVSNLPRRDLTIERARAAGCWTVHPIKQSDWRRQAAWSRITADAPWQKFRARA